MLPVDESDRITSAEPFFPPGGPVLSGGRPFRQRRTRHDLARQGPTPRGVGRFTFQRRRARPGRRGGRPRPGHSPPRDLLRRSDRRRCRTCAGTRARGSRRRGHHRRRGHSGPRAPTADACTFLVGFRASATRRECLATAFGLIRLPSAARGSLNVRRARRAALPPRPPRSWPRDLSPPSPKASSRNRWQRRRRLRESVDVSQ